MVQARIQHDCSTELHGADLKATPARLAIMQLLEKTEQPIDVATITDYLKATNIKADQATVFRIINMFTDRGLTKQIQLNEGKFRYELSSKPEHHHLICQQCGTIEDISDCAVGDLEKDIEKKKDFKIASHSLEFYGMCRNCQQKIV
ncbi:MAG: Fur family transcriptional regulator [Patescibacteria group bacterium]